VRRPKQEISTRLENAAAAFEFPEQFRSAGSMEPGSRIIVCFDLANAEQAAISTADNIPAPIKQYCLATLKIADNQPKSSKLRNQDTRELW
jgi:hypothetical protein